MNPLSRSCPSLLLVDDCAPERNLCEMALGGEFSIPTADRDADGLALAARAGPDAILLDLRMPFVDGLAFLRRLRAHKRTAVRRSGVTADPLLRLIVAVSERGAESSLKTLRVVARQEPRATRIDIGFRDGRWQPMTE